MATLDLAGQKYGRLTVLKRVENTNAGKTKWLCQCDCGKMTKVVGSNLKNGMTKSCGCLSVDMLIERSTKHGLDNSRICIIWRNMKSRCHNSKNKQFKNYGGRGIYICDEWLGENALKNFADWSFENGYSEKLTIDRIDNNKGYSPDNCRWVDCSVQANNKRNNILITNNGKTQTLVQWCKELKISRSMVRNRIERGWEKDMLLIPPVRKIRRLEKS